MSPDGTKIQIQSAMLSADGKSMNICVIPIPEEWLERREKQEARSEKGGVAGVYVEVRAMPFSALSASSAVRKARSKKLEARRGVVANPS
jgi:hypothetical protein